MDMNSKCRAAVTNGTKLLPGEYDARSPWGRRLRDLMSDLSSDLGGQDNLCQADHILIRRTAMLALQAELLEAKFAKSPDGIATIAELDAYQRTVNSTRRVLESLYDSAEPFERQQVDISEVQKRLTEARAKREARSKLLDGVPTHLPPGEDTPGEDTR
jgi:hypothetical protein